MGNIQNAIIIFGAKYLIFFVIGIAFLYFLKQPREKQKEIAIFGIISLPIIYIFAKIASLLYYDPRPFVVGNFNPLIPHVSDNGFPSDHTLLSSAIAMIVFYFNKRIGAALFVLAIMVGLSRVLAGVHHITDIAGSVIISGIFSYLVYRILVVYRNKI